MYMIALYPIRYYESTEQADLPPKGGSAASDADIKAAVQYMVAAVK